jgi:hypothetical protein
METFLIGAEPFLIGAVSGAGFTLATILGWFKVVTKEKWAEFQMEMQAQRNLGDKLTAENAKLRVGLAAGQMTEDGKKVAAMTMAALEEVLWNEEVA